MSLADRGSDFGARGAVRYATGMPDPFAEPAGPDLDENGVDLAQIRALLRLTPEQRLRRMEEFVQSVLEVRECNDRPLR